MPPPPALDISEWIDAWAKQPSTSARSVLATIIGDTLLPVGESIWMAQAVQLASVFGFSNRLVRTSMFRLSSDGWLTNERVGRRSRYHVTELARRESARAAERIYRIDDVDWTGDWTLLFLAAAAGDDADAAGRVIDRLRWNGFVRIGHDVLAAPETEPEIARSLIALIAPQLRPAIATAHFTDLDHLIDAGFFLGSDASSECDAAWKEFVDRYEPLRAHPAPRPRNAFALRTMMIHDLRRIRLRWPDPPPATVPASWEGGAATALAADLYRTLGSATAEYLGEVLGLEYPATISGRFGQTP